MRSQVGITEKELARRLHPRLSAWFRATYSRFTHAQLLCVPPILERQSILLTSPTGSGKTLAAFLGVFDAILRKIEAGALSPSVQCLYVSPLRALAYDIGNNVRAPITGMGLEKKLRLALRTGDTPSSERVKFRERGAHIVITTPESLAVMLAQESYSSHLAECEFVVVATSPA
jgi:ATP-dependent Lhr-like helicase